MKPVLHVLKARHEGDYRLWVLFNDGAEGIVDLKDDLYGEMFSPLKDPSVFRDFWVDPELETVVWRNGSDFAPEFLRRRISPRPRRSKPSLRRRARH